MALCAHDDLNPLELLTIDWPRWTGVDLSTDKRPGNAFVTIAQNPANQRRIVVDVRAMAIKSPEVWRQLEEINRLFRPNIIMVENNALQGAVMEWGLELNATLPVKGFLTGKNKADEQIGLPGLEVEFSNGGWIIPRPSHTYDCSCAWCQFWSEFTSHPLSETNDLVMATWFAREAARTTSDQLQWGPSPLAGYRG